MNRLIHIIVISMLLCNITGCEQETPIEPQTAVIEGWIDSDGYPVVIFTSSLVPDEAGGQISDKIIRWGKVTVSDGDTTVILTGGMWDNYFPPYRYYSFDIRGVPGKAYKVTADYEGLHAEATCTMPYPTEIDSVSIAPINGSDSLRNAIVHFTAPVDCPAYYYLTIRDLKKRGRPSPAMMGSIRADSALQHMSIPLFNSKNSLDSNPFVAQLKVGQKIAVGLCRIPREVYEFWTGFNNVLMFGGSQFISASNSLRGNIDGAYGVWSAQGVATQVVEVK